ncbi:hypothetical protein SAMN05421676_1128 [Salinibacillus kushneri]|uniref:Tail assembly chaperone n=1 Tax=Salinibacillus kushneri TaxID=237682 RepID=A0A1I0IF73_9BACI|nr:hypothetical protein [Salinibacillus kushneri]SET94668.1 hypothetical protein SAMN05421676_1128 [Salinibacillus kushneri]
MGMKDFDAYFSETKKEPKQFKVKGEVFTLPESLPAVIMFKVMRMQSHKGADGDVSTQEAMDMMEHVFGKETNERLLETGIGFDEYQEILKWAMNELSGMGEQKSTEGQAQKHIPTTTKSVTS